MSRDPLEEIFRSMDPTKRMSDAQIDAMVPTQRLLAHSSDSRQLSLFGRLRPRVWRQSVVVSTIAVLVVAGAATAITLARSPASTVTNMTCFQGVSLRSTSEVVSYSNGPLATCSQLMHWPTPRSGTHRSGMLCILSDGSVAAFPPSPRPENCAALGLAIFNGKLASPRVAAFQRSAQSFFVAHECDSAQNAKKEILLLLGRYGVVGWRVKTSGSASLSACATLAIEVAKKLVDIVGVRLKSPPG